MTCWSRTDIARSSCCCRMFCFAVLYLLLADLSVTRAASPQGAKAPPITLANRQLEILLDGNRGGLLQIRELATGHDHLVSPVEAKRELWNLRARSNGEAAQVSPAGATSFRWEKGSDRAAVRLIWGGFQLPAAPELTVEVDVRLDDRVPDSIWELAIRSPGDLSVEEIRFPIVSGITSQEDEILAVPHWMGEMRAEPRKMLAGADGKGRRLQWPYPGHLSLQCLAYYRSGGPGIFLACRDATAQRKSFAVWGDPQSRVGLEVVHYPEPQRSAPECLAIGYPVVLGAFCGDWLTAAERYRDWAIQQAWVRESRLQQGLVPQWVLNTGLWVWNRGRSPLVLPPAAALRKQLGLPVSVFWHWWHGCPYDTGFPEYLPPREGEESFRAALAEARQADIRTLVYMNQRLWGMTTRSWAEEGAAAWAVKDADGKIRPEIYNTFTRQACASMCMGTEFWRNKYAGLAEQAVRGLGVNGIYMDQACSSLPCYDPKHGHPLGAGSFWTEGFRMLADDIRKRCAAEPVALAGEGCGEAWLPHLDLMLTLQVSRERYAAIQDGWEVIPFFHAVYHPYAILYGNYSSLTVPPYDDLWPADFAPARPLELLDRKFSGQFYLEQARAFVWGQQPTIANFLPVQLDERSEEIGYLLRLAKLRSRAQKYLVRGTLLRAPAIDAPEVLLDFSRLSIYAGQQDRVQSFQKTCPAALAGAWRAPDGAIGIALASIVQRPMSLAVRLDPEDHKLPQDARAYRIDEEGRNPIDLRAANDPALEVELPPLGACVVEIAR